MKRITSTIVTLLLLALPSFGQSRIYADFKPVGDSLKVLLQKRTSVRSGLRVEKVMKRGDIIDFYFSPELSDYPWTEPDIKWFKSELRRLTPSAYKKYAQGEVFGRGFALDDLMTPPLYSDGKAHKSSIRVSDRRTKAPLVRPADGTWFSKGLSGRHIALWQSHGRYYETKTSRWEWQRAALHRTVEDMYTQSYVLPFLIPMLENAGAYVLTPRERDTQSKEIICDNDPSFSGDRYADMRKSGLYSEKGSWKDAGVGFADGKAIYSGYDNPFTMGTVRSSECAEKAGAHATWTPDIPERGFYAVYVSYKTLANSSSAVNYTVHHLGGQSKFIVNQKMGGGTWICLGFFDFDAGSNGQGVYLSNSNSNTGSIVSADAVKFGGGMGNVARSPLHPEFEIIPETSGYPRAAEGSRYWLQWAGFNDTIYSRNRGTTDYNDDYMSRGLWVNTISDGSYLKPGKEGYNIPVDLSFAFHTDAGTTLNDSIVGTLAIYTRLSNDDEKYPNGEDRSLGRDYTDIVQTQIVNDIRALYEPLWSRRQLWDRSYAESRMPEVPGMLLELLSHQNLADMRYGLDPNFRFTVSRAIYKGMLKFLAWINDFDYTVQPLPVSGFEVHLGEEGQACLSWEPTPDPLEPTAHTTGYILYTRIDDAGFDAGRALDESHAEIALEPGHLYSFRVSATNEGGESFPSEVLSVGVVSEEAPTVLVVNNFDRVSAPVSFASRDSSYAGFMNRLDGGVPWNYDISYIGNQHDFRRHIPWMDDDSPGFGASDSDYETKVIAGNTFDYPAVHGRAWMEAGFNFVSASRSAVVTRRIEMNRYVYADLICGKQVTTQVGRRGAGPLRYQVFPAELRGQLEDFTRSGGSLLVSGAHVGSDLWEPIFDFEVDSTLKADYFTPGQKFAQEVLHYRWMTNSAAVTGEVKGVQNELGLEAGSRYVFNTQLNDKCYCVEAPDGLNPAGDGSYTVFRYAENNISAGVAYKGDYKTVILGFPVETLETQEQVNGLIGEIARFFAP